MKTPEAKLEPRPICCGCGKQIRGLSFGARGNQICQMCARQDNRVRDEMTIPKTKGPDDEEQNG